MDKYNGSTIGKGILYVRENTITFYLLLTSINLIVYEFYRIPKIRF